MATHPKATDGGRVYFSRRQLFTVATLFGTSSAVIFFLGILIGQSIEERKLLRREEPAVNVAVESGAPKADQEMTFYDTLTKKEPTPPPEKTEKPSQTRAVQTPWTVQVVASRSRDTAEKIVAALNKLGYKAYVTSIKLNQKTFYRVRVGAYRSRQAAQAALDRLKTRYENAEIKRNR